MAENNGNLSAARLGDYTATDRAFYSFWYGHMLGDLMQPPLTSIDHATARYIWDAATVTKQAEEIAGLVEALSYWLPPHRPFVNQMNDPICAAHAERWDSALALVAAHKNSTGA